VFSAFFSASETAFSSLNTIRVKQLTKNPKKVKSAKRVLYVYKRYEMFLTSVLVLNNVINISITVIATLYFALYHVDLSLVTLFTSITLILLGEIVPKNVARHVPEKVATLFAPVVIFLMTLLTPISFLIKGLDWSIAKVFDEDDEEHVTATEKELITIVETIEKEGVLEQDESLLIRSAIVFDEKSVLDAMKKKENITYFYASTSFDEMLAIIKEKGYTRYPVLNQDDQIVGIIHQKDVFNALVAKQKYEISDLISPPVFISYRRLLPYALEKLQRVRIHMAIVVDNMVDKKFLGIITLEDILEELVGEIYDETDHLPKGVITYGTHIYEVEGSVMVDDMFDYLKETENPRTNKNIGDWVAFLCKKNKIKIKNGSQLAYDNIDIKIIEVAKVKGKDKIVRLEIDENSR
jgi:CBS domain containing-hemolysin-like protein